jgi:hypothetical protein
MCFSVLFVISFSDERPIFYDDTSHKRVRTDKTGAPARKHKSAAHEFNIPMFGWFLHYEQKYALIFVIVRSASV